MKHEKGLTTEEAKKRLLQYGPNVYWQKKGFDFGRFIREEILSLFNIILFTACAISFLGGGSTTDSIIIFILVFSSIIISFFSELNFHHLYSKLQKLLQKKVLTIRNGKSEVLLSQDLVPDDLIYLTKGEKIPADCAVVTELNLLVDESVLTGESVPVQKKVGDELFAGSELLDGECEARVVHTGIETQFAKIGKLALETQKKSAYQKELDIFTKYLVKIVTIFVSLIFVANLITKGFQIQTILLFSLVLGVSIIPEFLPPITASALALASGFFAKKKNIIKRLTAIEDMGLIDVLCVDKTGTITTNNLSLQAIEAADLEEFYAFTLSGFWGVSQKYLSDFEVALEKSLSGERKKKVTALLDQITLVDRKLFDPRLRLSQTLIKKSGKTYRIVVGAPESLLRYAKQDDRSRKLWEEKITSYSSQGFRVYAVGLLDETKGYILPGQDRRDLKFLGLAAFGDTLKSSAKAALQKAEEIGVRVKIITGDHPQVAEKVARDLGLLKEGERVITEDELMAMPHRVFQKAVADNHVFARIRPQMKYHIVQALQKKYQVGYLGEGINDLPVIKLANVGMVVDSAIDASKEVADVIIMEKDLMVIVDGIFLGRKVFYNILKYLKHTMSDNFGNFFSVGILSVFLPFSPLTPLQILLTNFITDLPLFGIAFDKVDDREIQRPAHYKLRELFILLIGLGAVGAFFNLLVFGIFRGGSEQVIRTAIYLQTTFSGIIVFYSIRTRDWFFRSAPSMIMNILVLFSIILTFISLLYPFNRLVGIISLGWQSVLFIMLLNVVYLFTNDLMKVILIRKYFEKE